jgi:hypothetical protein
MRKIFTYITWHKNAQVTCNRISQGWKIFHEKYIKILAMYLLVLDGHTGELVDLAV